MKKLYSLFSLMVLGTLMANASVVPLEVAKTAAANFYHSIFPLISPNLQLISSQNDGEGQPVYYVFNVNSDQGFVIISAEDATEPIIGYSDKGHYVVPANNTNMAYWMQTRKNMINAIRTVHQAATNEIKEEWGAYIHNLLYRNPHHILSAVLPLMQTVWDQSPYYNDDCPGGSVTGCVATAMAQIMKFWAYPAHGIGTRCYWDLYTNGDHENYGELCATYDTSNYGWTAMPNYVSSANSEVAKLMYDCGVSLDMDYSPTSSGAAVTIYDGSVCAQTAFVNYFGYNAYTIQGVLARNYTDSAWIALLENELNNSRPIQLAGGDHSWVCDGYDASNNLHMNWGWGGLDDGYYAINNFNVDSNNFNTNVEAVIGIEPATAIADFIAQPTTGCPSLTVSFKDLSIGNAPMTGWNWSFPGGSPPNSPAQNPIVTYGSPGTYTVTEIASNINGTDTLTKTAYITVVSPVAPPFIEGFQSTTFPPAGWYVYNPDNYTSVWQLDTLAGGYGLSTKSMSFDNCSPTTNIKGERQQIYTQSYDFSSISSPELYFDVAYAPYNTTYSDTLAIYYSTDCGTTFSQIYLKGGMTLCTTGLTVANGANIGSNGCFLPLSNNWRTDTINLGFLAGYSSVMFSFENRSGTGSVIYIDNINIPAVLTSVQNISVVSDATIYPNPNNGQFTLELENITEESQISIYDVLGQTVYSGKITDTGNSNHSFNLSGIEKGIYLISIRGKGFNFNKKLIIY